MDGRQLTPSPLLKPFGYFRWQPDWALMGIRMKRMNGLAVTRELLAVYPAARVVMLSHYNDKELREAARRAGACEYVCKENLLEVRQLLTRNGE